MKIFMLCTLSLLLFACNGDKKNRQELEAQQRQIDSLKATVKNISLTVQTKSVRDSIRRSKIAYWKKQTTLMTVNLYADKAILGKAKRIHLGRTPAQRKKAIEESNKQLIVDLHRTRQVMDSLRKYQE
jgi:hypothetical protein